MYGSPTSLKVKLATNAMQTGLAGNGGPYGVSDAEYPALWPLLYQPDLPVVSISSTSKY